MKPYNNDGVELDSIFSVRPTSTGAEIILESRGGGVGGPRPPRNADYARGLELLLRRLGSYGAVLTSVEVFSRETEGIPATERQIFAPDFPFPVDLASLNQFEIFRLQIGRASAAFGKKPGSKGGNSTKRLRLSIAWPEAVGQSASTLEDQLARVSRSQKENEVGDHRYAQLGHYLASSSEPELRLKLSEISGIIGAPLPDEAWTPQFWANAADYHQTRRGQWLNAGYKAYFERRSETVRFERAEGIERRSREWHVEQPTADPEELEARISAAIGRLANVPGEAPPPPGSQTAARSIATVTRYTRDPNVVAWVQDVAQGRCEACDEPAPFISESGMPFLEVHHVRPLGEGGPDMVDNAVAACPNCHRRMHFGFDREEFRLGTIAKVERLKNYPYVPVEREKNVSSEMGSSESQTN